MQINPIFFHASVHPENTTCAAHELRGMGSFMCERESRKTCYMTRVAIFLYRFHETYPILNALSISSEISAAANVMFSIGWKDMTEMLM